MELEFVEEEIPQVKREGGAGRTAEKWEDHLSPLKAEELTGKSFRVWTYPTKPSAQSRLTTVRNRLYGVTPKDNWTVAVRPVDGGEFGVFVRYNGEFTPEQMADNAKKTAERSARIKNRKVANQDSAPAPTPATPTPAAPAPAKGGKGRA